MSKQSKTSPNTLSFIDVSPPNELVETLRNLNATMAREQAEKNREGREQRRQRDRLNIVGDEVFSITAPKPASKGLKDPDKTKWYTNLNNGPHAGYYEISLNVKIPFRGGYFGGIDQLIKNSGRDTTRNQLREAISKHLQGTGKKPIEINLSDWKNYLLKKRKDFCKYFLIKYTPPSYYRLFLLG